MWRLIAAIALTGLVGAGAPADELVNLAAGKPCVFAPEPNYDLTARGGTDRRDLTDGRLSERPDHNMWFESRVVGWTYLPLINVRVDLGQVQPIGEVVMRFLGGSPRPGICLPTFVRVLVSDDDQTYTRVAEFSRWQPGDEQRFGVPTTTGESWIHPLRFTGLRTRGRYVGLAIGGTGTTCSDELYVYRGDHDPATVTLDPAQRVDFSVSRPQIALPKPYLVLPTGIASPQPFVLIDTSGVKRRATLQVQTPRQVEVVAPEATAEKLPDGGTRYRLALSAPGTTVRPWVRLYLRSSLPAGTDTALTYSLDCGARPSPPTTVPVRIADMPPAPQCRRMMLALGWWALADTEAWPDGLAAARAIGLNTLSTFTKTMKPDDAQVWALADQARQQGFRLLDVDSTWHQIVGRHKDDPSIFCQFADGTVGKSLCPSYRGQWYADDLQRIARECARLKPDVLSTDVELWNWRGPVDAEKCTRCQADKQASGIATWEEWKLQKGYEMWRDLNQAVQAAVKDAGGKPVELGCYDWRPGRNYQQFWPFDRLYRDKLAHNSQCSTYSSLLPYDLEFIGDEAREERAKLPRTEGLPWLTPGDAGAFPAEALRCAMLECFLNGSRGIHFWSNRYWDGEDLLAYNEAVREVAPVEDIILDGSLYDRADALRPARVSGMIRGRDIALLVGQYWSDAVETINVTLDVPADSEVIETLTGRKLHDLPAGRQQLPVTLDEHRSKVLLIRAK